MAEIKVNTNGQQGLTVQASVSHWTSAALALAASAANDVESTTVTTITSDYSLHFADTATTALITVKQPDGTTLISQTFDVSPGTGPRVLNPLPDQYQVAADLSSGLKNELGSGQSTIPRWAINSAAVAMATGTMRLSRLTATKTESVTKARLLCGSTAAAATPTLVRYGLYSVTAAGAATLVASTANDTALLATQNTAYEKAFSVAYTVTEGNEYLLGLLVVTAGQAPTLHGTITAGGASVTTEAAILPRACGSLAAQTDLPASFANGDLSASTSVFYGVIAP